MKNPLSIIAAATLFAASAFSQTPTPAPTATPTPTPTATPTPTPTGPPTFAQATAAYNALQPSAGAQAYLNAANVVLGTADLPADQRGVWLGNLASATSWSGDKVTAMGLYLQAYQAGDKGSIVHYSWSAVALGGSYLTAAQSQIASLLTSDPSDTSVLWANAEIAMANAPAAQAFSAWQAVADNCKGYEWARGVAIHWMAKMSAKRGDSPATTNGIIIPYITAYNVHFADDAFQGAFADVVRTPSVLPTAQCKAFLSAILTIVDVTDANAKFLGMVQSQYAAIPAS